MFDDTTLRELYGDPVVARHAMIAALAGKALRKICNESTRSCETARVSQSAARKAERIMQRCRMTGG